MKLIAKNLRFVFITCFLMSSFNFHAQGDTTFKSPFDSISFTYNPTATFNILTGFNSIYHLPDEEDEKNYEANKSLIGQLPTEKNHVQYFQLACSLWDLEMIKEAEKMFLNIIRSNGKFYTSTYYYSSDVPGDTTTNIYGYGSFTSNYKNEACIYLTKIYIEQKQFNKALDYLTRAINKYKVYFTCGTGSMMQENEYKSLRVACYKGLGRNKELFDILLPQFLDYDPGALVGAIRKLYTKSQINHYLAEAERSITYEADTFQSYYYTTHNYGEANEWNDTTWYYGGRATTKLFGKKIHMPAPLPKNGEKRTKEYFIQMYKESAFYQALKEERRTARHKDESL